MSKYYPEKQSQKKGEGKEERNRDDGVRLEAGVGGYIGQLYHIRWAYDLVNINGVWILKFT